MLLRACLLAALLSALRAQRARFSCNSEGRNLICRSNDTRVEFLDESVTWREGHELCRRRGGFLVPSRAAFYNTLLRELYGQAMTHGAFWMGAKYLRNGYFEWLLQAYDEPVRYEQIVPTPTTDPSNLCGHVGTVRSEMVLQWLPCNATLKVVCYSDGKTEAEIRPRGYRPTMSVASGDSAITSGASTDAVRVVSGDVHLSLECNPGDSVVKDYFILGKTRYLSRWWDGNFTITRQIVPSGGGNFLGVGTFWCQRYVEGTVDAVVGGRLHLTTSEDMYVLTAPEDSVVEALRLLLPDGTEYEDGLVSDSSYDEYEYADRSLLTSRTSNITVALDTFLGSVANGPIRFLALYDFPNINSTGTRQETSNGADGTSGRRTRRAVSLIMESSAPLNRESLRGINSSGTGTAAQGQLFLHEAFRCSEENVGGHVWRRSSNRTGYTASQPACVAPDFAALVQRRCEPSFGRAGARWGPFCAAGVCRQQLPQCELPPPACPPGFTSTADVGSEDLSGLCTLLLTNVSFEERGLACRQQEPSSTPWFPRQRQLEGGFLATVLSNQTLWLPFRRLWEQGMLLPQVLDLLGRDDRAASLNVDLNCTVLTPRGRLASASCTGRRAVLCATRPLYSLDGRPGLRPSITRGRFCQSALGPGTKGSQHCFAFLCPNTTSPITWSNASSRCVASNSSLASLTSQRQMDAVVRIGRTLERAQQVAVNLVKRNGRAVWGDGTLLSYPALSPNLSAGDRHTHGILDVSHGQYEFVEGDRGDVSCALCGKYVQSGTPEIVLFYGDAQSDTLIYANVTSIQHFVTDWEDFLSCFVSTATPFASLLRPTESPADARDGFRARFEVLPATDDSVFIRLFPSVDFGYLTCGLLAPESGVQITSNSLALKRERNKAAVQEYVIGLRGGQWRNPECDLTLCGSTCACFNQSFTSGYRLKDDLEFYLRIHPLRVTPVKEAALAYYYVTIDFNPPLRRRRQADPRGSDHLVHLTNRTEHSRRRLRRQTPARYDGMQVLRADFRDNLVYVRHARCCPAELTQDPVPLSWTETCGGVATSEELCVDGSGLPALRRCRGGPLTGVEWGPVEFRDTSCSAVRAVTSDLHRLSRTAVTEANVASTASDLERLTAEPSVLLPQDLVSATVTLENIRAGLERPNRPSAENITTMQRSTVATASHIMDADRVALTAASKLLSIGPRAVVALERILIDSSAENAPDVTTNNVAVRSGNFVGILSSSKEIVGSSLRPIARLSERPATFGVEASLLLESMGLNVPVVFLVYRDGRLLPSPGQRVTSQVVSALLPSEHSDLQIRSGVRVTFRSRLRPCVPAPAPKCVFWDTAASRWSSRGCWLEKIHKGSDVCRCNHLTNFARIFNYEDDVYLGDSYQRVLDVLTYLGSAVSLVGLFLTMLTFVLFREWRRLRDSQIVMNLSVALTGVYLSFLGGLAATENHVACVCLSALLHFFLLATFGWMAVEAVFQYLRFVRVVGTYIPRFMLKAGLLVWGGSSVPVIWVLATRPHCYDGQPDICWMDFHSFYYALVLPMAIEMVFNAFMFSLIVYSLNCGRRKGLRTNQPEQLLARRRLRVSLVTFVLLGLPWGFGLLAVREARHVFAVLFCLCSMGQGFAIFLLMVAGSQGVRGLWRSLAVTRCCAAATGAGPAPKPANSATGETSETMVSSRSQQNTRL